MDFERSGIHAEAIAKWIQDRTDVQVCYLSSNAKINDIPKNNGWSRPDLKISTAA